MVFLSKKFGVASDSGGDSLVYSGFLFAGGFFGLRRNWFVMVVWFSLIVSFKSSAIGVWLFWELV